MRWLGFGAKGEHAGVLLVDVRPDVGHMTADIRHLEFEDGEFEGVECHHVLEHLTREDGLKAAKELYRVLSRGGVLELSCPDLEACARTLLTGNTDVLMNIFSPHDEPAQMHRWGYTPKTILRLLESVGFHDIVGIPVTEPHELRLRAFK